MTHVVFYRIYRRFASNRGDLENLTNYIGKIGFIGGLRSLLQAKFGT